MFKNFQIDRPQNKKVKIVIRIGKRSNTHKLYGIGTSLDQFPVAFLWQNEISLNRF